MRPLSLETDDVGHRHTTNGGCVFSDALSMNVKVFQHKLANSSFNLNLSNNDVNQKLRREEGQCDEEGKDSKAS